MNHETSRIEWAEAYDSHDEGRLSAALGADAVLVSPEGVFEGRAAVVDYMMAWARAFGGGYTIEHVTAAADTVVLEMTWRGMHTGVYTTAGGDIAPTHNAIEAAVRPTPSSSRAALATNVRMYFDVYGFLSQLGLLPGGAEPG